MAVNAHLEALPEQVLKRLYQSPATCLAIFRMLPSMAKWLIMSALFTDQPLNVADVDYSVKLGSKRLELEALKKLKGLHLMTERRAHQNLKLNPVFRKSLRDAITAANTEANSSFGVPCETEDKHKVDVRFLDDHAKRKWEDILHYMVGTPGAIRPSDGVLKLLEGGGLLVQTFDGPSITNEGFQFLLQDINTQIWTLLLQYLDMSPSLKMDPVDVLNFIFMLGSLELGKDYTLSALSQTQVYMLEDLRDYGLVYQRKSSSRRYYPTRLATTLTSDSAGQLRTASSAMDEATGSAVQTGFIILETNYRLYAYTDSPLQIAVLNLFVSLKTRFANMVTGKITRQSIRQALMNGIHAEQILTYLTVHAHPQMKKQEPILPPTVVDQIRLWQLELDRLKATEGYLFKDFRDQKEYKLVVDYAEELGVLTWHNPLKRRFFVTTDGSKQVVEFVNRRSKGE